VVRNEQQLRSAVGTDATMPRTVFHHVGIACRSIDAEIAGMAVLGYVSEGPIVADPIQKVRLQFFVGGGPRLELIEPAAQDSPVRDILKRGKKFYHVAYEVDDFQQAVRLFETKSYMPISPIARAAAFGMRKIVFMASATATVVELIEADQPRDIEQPA
jgi:methylmalonyl-CoA/ethylmalonyl-CoA epimerase